MCRLSKERQICLARELGGDGEMIETKTKAEAIFCFGLCFFVAVPYHLAFFSIFAQESLSGSVRLKTK